MKVVISDRFPYRGEPFLKVEDKYLQGDVVYFALQAGDNPKDEDITRDSYSLHVGKMTPIMYLLGIRGIFSGLFADELRIMKKRKVLSLANIRKAVGMYGRAKMAESMIRGVLRQKYSEGSSSGTVVLYSYWMAVHALTGVMLKKKLNARFVTRCHSYDLYEFRSDTGYIPFRRAIFDSADLICPISDNGRDYILNNYGEMSDKKLLVQRLGTENHGINPQEQGEEYVIVSCANIVKEKRLDLIVSALFKIDYKIKWIHFGEGDKGEVIRSLAGQLLDDKPNIQYSFRGRVPNEEIMTFYQNNHVDLFVNTSEIEGIPVSIMETMSFGIPAIATDVGGTNEIIEHDVNGRLIEKNVDAETIKEEIINFMNLEGPVVEAFRHNARKKWEELYSAEKNYSKFEKLLNQ